MQWLTRKCTTNGRKYVEGIHSEYNYSYIHCAWILYTNCIHNVYEVHFLWIKTDVYRIFVYKMYPTVLQTTFVYILYTKSSWHSSFILVYKICKKVVEMWHILCTFYIHFLYISCIHLVQFLYTKCIHSFRVGLSPGLKKRVLNWPVILHTVFQCSHQNWLGQKSLLLTLSFS